MADLFTSGMSHGERIKLVRGIHLRMMKVLSEESVIVGGVYGSTSNGSDTPFSDIEMLYLIDSSLPSEKVRFLYGTTPIEIQLFNQVDWQHMLIHLTIETPYWVGSVETMQMLVGTEYNRNQTLVSYRALDDGVIRAFFQTYGSEIGVESFHKIQSASRRAAAQELPLYIFELLHEVHLALALINRVGVKKGYLTGIKQGIYWPKIPDGYADGVRDLIRGMANGAKPTEVLPVAQLFLENFWRLLEDNSYALKKVTTLNDLDWKSMFTV